MRIRMLGRKSKVDQSQRVFYKGQVVRTEKGFFYINSNSRQEFCSDSVLESYNIVRFVEASEDQLGGYPIVGKVPFRTGTLIFDSKDGTYRICQGDKLTKLTPMMMIEGGLISSDAIQVFNQNIFGLKKVGGAVNG